MSEYRQNLLRGNILADPAHPKERPQWSRNGHTILGWRGNGALIRILEDPRRTWLWGRANDWVNRGSEKPGDNEQE